MIGQRIKSIRVKSNLTQEKLAERMEINTKYLSSIERGKENPTLNTIICLAEALEVDIGDIFSSLQNEDPAKRKSLINSLLKEANEEELKLAYKVLSAVLKT